MGFNYRDGNGLHAGGDSGCETIASDHVWEKGAQAAVVDAGDEEGDAAACESEQEFPITLEATFVLNNGWRLVFMGGVEGW